MSLALMSTKGGRGAPYSTDVFGATLYTGAGTGAGQNIITGFDMTVQPMMLWIKVRNAAGRSHYVFTTASGSGLAPFLSPNTNFPRSNGAANSLYYQASGFGLGGWFGLGIQGSGDTHVAYTFKPAPRFLSIVEYTGDGTANRAIPHALGIEAGFAMVKATNASTDWDVYHRSATGDLLLNSTAAMTASRTAITAASAASITVAGTANVAGQTYIAFIFAHDTSADGVVQCSVLRGTGVAGNNLTLGWRPQFFMVKDVRSDNPYSWMMQDDARGPGVALVASTNNAELGVGQYEATDTGIQAISTNAYFNGAGADFLVFAIRAPNKPVDLSTYAKFEAWVNAQGATADYTLDGSATPNITSGTFRLTVAASTAQIAASYYYGSPYNNTSDYGHGPSGLGAAAVLHCMPSAAVYTANIGQKCLMKSNQDYRRAAATTRNGYTSLAEATYAYRGRCTDFIYWDTSLGKAMRCNPSIASTPTEFIGI